MPHTLFNQAPKTSDMCAIILGFHRHNARDQRWRFEIRGRFPSLRLMRLPLLRILFPFIALFAGSLRADPADDAVAAVLKLRSRGEYIWDVSTTKPGVYFNPPRTKHGGVTSNGETVLEQIWADGLVLETVIRPDGSSVVRTPDGWFTKAELENLSRRPKRGSNSGKWLHLAADALEPMTLEEELTHLLNDSTAYERDGDTITATLSERGATYWLGSTRLIAKATGTVRLRLQDGLIRECRITAEGEETTNSTGTEFRHVAFESVITFNYSVTPSPIAIEAKQKLDALAQR
jgi:hypothetical protein